MDTEIIATSAVKEIISKTALLKASINEGDKGVFWDGHIDLYSAQPLKKKTWYDRIPVQVKGRERNNISRESVRFQISKTDLNSYKKDGGLLYFLVLISNNGEKKVYYSELLPYVVNNYMRSVPRDKPSVSVEFKPFPDNVQQIQRIMFYFAHNRRNQSGIRGRDYNYTLPELITAFGENELEFELSPTGVSCRESIIGFDQAFLYARKKGIDAPFPFLELSNIELRAEETKVVIQTDTRTIHTCLTREINDDSSLTLKIGSSVVISEIERDKFSVHYDLKGSLDDRIDALDIIIGMVSDNGILIDGFPVRVNPSSSDMVLNNIDDRIGQLNYFREIRQVLNELGVKDSLNMDVVTEKQNEYIKMLVSAFCYNREISFKGDDYNIPIVGTIEIGNLILIISFIKMAGGKYRLENFFDTDFNCSFDKEGNYLTSQFCLLNRKDYLNCSNLNVSKIIDDFKRFDNVGHFAKLTFCVLEMLFAFDEDRSRIDLLECAREICLWRISRDDKDVIDEINYYQCVARNRELNEDEKEKIAELSLEKYENPLVIICLNILLGNTPIAKKLIQRLDADNKNQLMDFPIMHLVDWK